MKFQNAFRTIENRAFKPVCEIFRVKVNAPGGISALTESSLLVKRRMTHKPGQGVGDDLFMAERSTIKCNFFKKANFSVTLAPGYQGIPENLIINLVMWVVS